MERPSPLPNNKVRHELMTDKKTVRLAEKQSEISPRKNELSSASRLLEKFLSALKSCLSLRRPEEILSFCNRENSSLGLVAAAGVKAAIVGENVELALNVAYDKEAMKLRARLNYLSMIVTLAPLLGLLGTISGMIDSFNIFSLQAGQPLAITGGIGEALIATATGLCVSIFALLVHTYFAQKTLMPLFLSGLMKVF